MKLNIISSLFAATATLSTLLIAVPAKAIIYDWQFTNEDGNFGNSTDIIKGEVEFNNADVFPNATNVAATSLTITSIDNLTAPNPFFGDGGIELFDNLVVPQPSLQNRFYFNDDEDITRVDFVSILFSNNDREEQLQLDEPRGGSQARSILLDRDNGTNFFSDENSLTLQFTQQTSASVPFEFSPTTGLFLVGGIFGLKRYVKHRQANKLAGK